MKQFSNKTKAELKNYVYALVDPFTDEIFYVGKGSNHHRPFDHLKKQDEPNNDDLQKRISSIRSQGKEPGVDIIRYGLDRYAAHEVEAAVIDAIGLNKLTNSIRGHQVDRGRENADSLEQQLGGVPLDIESIDITTILFYCHQAYPKYNLYDSTRQFWNLNKNRIKRNNSGNLIYQYAFAMRKSTILDVYKILEWYPAGTSISSRTFKGDSKERWEFIGAPAEEKILKKYRNKVLHRGGKILHAPQKGLRYID
jgi:uncharacterized protein